MWAVIILHFLTFLSSPYVCLGYDGYSDLTSSHNLKWSGKCTSVPAGFNYNYRKGKSYETNYESYFAFFTCNGWSCDKTVERAIRVDDYFRATSGCVQDYCAQCSDAGCSSNCNTYGNMTSLTDDYGNSTYNGCSATTSSEGLRYYYGPQCTDDGNVTMGYFFDKHCQLNATRRRNIYSPDSFISFDVFRFVQSVRLKEDAYISFETISNISHLYSFQNSRSVLTAATLGCARESTIHHMHAWEIMAPSSGLAMIFS